MKKLLLIVLLIPCLLVWADNDDLSVLLKKLSGERIAVRVGDIDSMVIALTDTIDDSLFCWRDTVIQRDTLVDTLVQRDTIHDTIKVRDVIFDTIPITHPDIVVDTLILRDTLIERDTIVMRDTVVAHDTTVINNTEYVNYTGRWYFPLENPAVQDYMNGVTYDDEDYTVSYIEDFIADEGYRKEHPLGIPFSWTADADSFEISEDRTFAEAYRYGLADGATSFVAYNMIPGRRYYWRSLCGGSEVAHGYVNTLGRVRMINTSGVHNVRDIGGMPTDDGGSIAYGRFFRGGTLNPATANDKSILVDTLHIDYEIDVTVEKPEGTSPILGDEVGYIAFTGQNVNFIPYRGTYFASVFKKVVQCLADGKVVYLHCGGGADRTGAIALLMEAVCGCSEEDIAKGYELTSFSVFGVRKRVDGVEYDGNIYNYAKTINWLKSQSGDTFKDKVVTYLKRYGVTEEEIATLRNELVERR